MAENDAFSGNAYALVLELNVAARHSGLNNKLCGDDFRLLSHKLTAAFGEARQTIAD